MGKTFSDSSKYIGDLKSYELGSATQIWEAAVSAHNFPLASLYEYRGLVRGMILDFKVRGCWQVGHRLAQSFVSDQRVLTWLQGQDAIMPIPSSPWSRWRGRFDLAYLLAQKLSYQAELPLFFAPRRSFFRGQKQAFLPRSQRISRHFHPLSSVAAQVNMSLEKPYHSRIMNIVLIDDVVTSSNTLTGFALRFRNIRFKFLTLASAFHPTEAAQLL